VKAVFSRWVNRPFYRFPALGLDFVVLVFVYPIILQIKIKLTGIVMKNKFSVAAVLLCAQLGAMSLASAQVFTSPRHTEGGAVSGVVENGIEVFKGIPYAATTGGKYRWHQPRRAQHWHGIRQADTFGAVCAQEGSAGQVIGSEDCLSLNVYRPVENHRRSVRRAENMAVMVYIHGGGMKVGSGSFYDATELASQGVVVVTINYRLDFLGRYAHPAISASQQDEHLGNYALMDQIAALKWVKRNIRAFGGNPRKVTVFGHSSGGTSIHHLMGTPESKGLFRNAIAQSGGVSIGSMMHLDRPDLRHPVSLEDLGVQVAEFFGISNDEAAPVALRNLSIEQLILEFPDTDTTMAPVVDGTLVTEPLADTFFYGRQHRVNYMGGGTSDDFSLFRLLGVPVEALAEGFDVDEIKALYEGFPDNEVSGLWGTDLIGLGPHKFFAQQMRKVGRRGYFYYFDYIPPALQDHPLFTSGAQHGAELGFLFDDLGSFPFFFNSIPYVVMPEDLKMAHRIRTAWVNFAKYNNPNSYSERRFSRGWNARRLQWVPTRNRFDFTTVIDGAGIHAERDFAELESRMDFVLNGFEELILD